MPEVTKQPQGDYPRPEAMHHLDLNEHADSLLRELPGHGRRSRSLAREGGVSLIMIAMEAGDALDAHQAKGAVTVQTVRGHTTLSLEGSSFDLLPGQLVFFQPGVVHDLRAALESVVLLTITGGDE